MHNHTYDLSSLQAGLSSQLLEIQGTNKGDWVLSVIKILPYSLGVKTCLKSGHNGMSCVYTAC